MKIVKYILNTILSFFIIFVVFLLIGINILDNKLLNKNYVLSKMEEIKFYEQISREVESGFENYIYQSGLPEETIKDLFTEEMIRNDVNTLINCVYEGTKITLSTETLKNTLDDRIQEYLNSQNKKLTDDVKNNITKFEDLIINEYKENVNVSTTLYTKGHVIFEKVVEIREKIGKLPIVMLVVLIVLLVIINIKDLLSVLNFLAIAALSIGMLLKIGVGVLFRNIDFDNLLILAQSLSNLIINIVKENLYKLSEYGNIFIVCGITGILVSIILKNFGKSEKPKRRFKKNKIEE